MKLNKKLDRIAASCCLLLTLIGLVNPSTEDKSQDIKSLEESLSIEREQPFQLRKFRPVAQSYRARGICYGPYRKGQRPGGPEPAKEQIRQDLHLLGDDGWQMIRLYGTEPFARKVCELIRENRYPIKVVVGAWIATEKNDVEQAARNKEQINEAIKIANDFPEIVVAVSVANESQVSWSFHKVEPSTLIRYIRTVRSSIRQPVTVADDFKYWTTEESRNVAKEIDFIVTHIYAMWNGQKLDQAMEFTKVTYEKVRAAHPDRLIIIGEAGWATTKPATGEQSDLIKGVAGELQQRQFFQRFTAWVHKNKIPYFYFEAFDEPWKGSNDPGDVEKHWGLFREDRTRKPAIER